MSFIYKEEDPYHRSRVILATEGDEFSIKILRKFKIGTNEICFKIENDGKNLVGNAVELLLVTKALLTMQIDEINNKLSPSFNFEEYFDRYMREVYPKLKRKPKKQTIEKDKELLREFYFSALESEDAFAKRKNMPVTTLRSQRERYNLPPKSALVRVYNKAM